MTFDVATFMSPRSCRDDRTSPALGGSATTPSSFTSVEWSNRLAPLPSSRARGAKRFGIAFEQRVSDVLTAIYGRTTFRASPTIAYREWGRRRLAIPDGLLYLDDTVVVVEVKARHTAMVWPQLMERYLPLVRVLEPRRHVRTVEVCWSYDPSVILPGPHTLIDSLHRPGTGLEVLRWKI